MGETVHTLIRLPNWLGDAVMATGAVNAFAQRHADHSLTLMGPPAIRAVFAHAPYAHRYISFDRRQGGKALVQSAWRLRQEHIEQIILLPNSFSSALLARLAGIPKCIGYPIHGRRCLLTHPVDVRPKPTHQAAQYAQVLVGEPDYYPAQITVTGKERLQAWQQLRGFWKARGPVIGLAPGAAYGGAKRWPEERYAALAVQFVKKLDAPVLLFGTAAESAICERIAQKTGPRARSLAGATSLRQLFAMLQQCRLVVCNDSGVMHAAYAVGAHVVPIFGPTNPWHTAPMGERIHMIRHEIECSPCMERECPLGHHQCMQAISVGDVFNRCKTVYLQESIT